MESMFYNCELLESIDFPVFNSFHEETDKEFKNLSTAKFERYFLHFITEIPPLLG